MLANVIIFCGDMALLLDERRAVYSVCLDFRKAFNTVSIKILIERLMKHALNE